MVTELQIVIDASYVVDVGFGRAWSATVREVANELRPTTSPRSIC